MSTAPPAAPDPCFDPSVCLGVQELADANAKLENANTTLEIVKVKVAELNAKVQELEREFTVAVEDKEAAIALSERCQRKLELANRLITALASEGECSISAHVWVGVWRGGHRGGVAQRHVQGLVHGSWRHASMHSASYSLMLDDDVDKYMFDFNKILDQSARTFWLGND